MHATVHLPPPSGASLPSPASPPPRSATAIRNRHPFFVDPFPLLEPARSNVRAECQLFHSPLSLSLSLLPRPVLDAPRRLFSSLLSLLSVFSRHSVLCFSFSLSFPTDLVAAALTRFESGHDENGGKLTRLVSLSRRTRRLSTSQVLLLSRFYTAQLFPASHSANVCFRQYSGTNT